MVDPEIIAVNSNKQHTGDDKIKVVLLLYIAKLQVMRERRRQIMPPVNSDFLKFTLTYTVIVDIVYW